MSFSSFHNPNLLDPNASSHERVPSLPGITRAFPNAPLEKPEYYAMSMLNHHMHRSDGKRLAFLFGIFEAKDLYDKQYMDNEIASGNPYLRLATKDEVSVYNMRIDPRGTMQREMTPEIEARVKSELEASLRAELEKKLNSIGVVLTDEQKAMMAGAPIEKPVVTQPPVTTTSETAISGTDKLTSMKNRLQDGIKTEGATVLSSGSVPFSASITGSDKTTNFTEEKK
jgi:hypothetical protein